MPKSFVIQKTHSLFPNYHNLFIRNINKPVKEIIPNNLIKDDVEVKVDKRFRVKQKIREYLR